jgi:hypothetical protein
MSHRTLGERRTEPRYVAKEEAFVWDLRCLKSGYYPATIVDISRNGMRLESAGPMAKGSSIAVDFQGMIVCGKVQYCASARNGFILGLRIADVLDPLSEGADADQQSAAREAAGALAIVA